MKLSFRDADWRRVISFYIFLAGIVFLMAWPFTANFELTLPFAWYWSDYLGDSAPTWIPVALILSQFAITVFVGCLARPKPMQEQQVCYEDSNFSLSSAKSNTIDQTNTQAHESAATADENKRDERKQKEELTVRIDDRSFLDEVGVIIPCHHSVAVIQDTLRGVLHHFRPENVIVMDNGKTQSPTDDTIIKVREISDQVVYKWVPIGHKGMSLLMGNRLLPESVKYVLLIDDDVLLPKTMIFDKSYFEDDDQVSAIAYPIGVCGTDGTTESMNIAQRLTDFEFKFADTFRNFVSQYSTVLFAHGAIGLWRRDRFTEIYEKHPGLPIGEDGWAGRLNLMDGHSIKQDSGPLIMTESPADLVPKEWWGWMCRCWNGKNAADADDQEIGKPAVVAGYGSPNLFNQRACRWDMNAPRRIPCHIKLFFTYGWARLFKKCREGKPIEGLVFFFLVRAGLIRGAWELFKVYFYAGYIVHNALNAKLSWIALGFASVYALQLLKYFLINYWVWRKRQDLQVSSGILFLFPFYRSILSVYRFYGYWRSLLMYIPIVKSPKYVLGKTKEVKEVFPLVQRQTDADVMPPTKAGCGDVSETHDSDVSVGSEESDNSLYMHWI